MTHPPPPPPPPTTHSLSQVLLLVEHISITHAGEGSATTKVPLSAGRSHPLLANATCWSRQGDAMYSGNGVVSSVPHNHKNFAYVLVFRGDRMLRFLHFASSCAPLPKSIYVAEMFL